MKRETRHIPVLLAQGTGHVVNTASMAGNEHHPVRAAAGVALVEALGG